MLGILSFKMSLDEIFEIIGWYLNRLLNYLDTLTFNLTLYLHRVKKRVLIYVSQLILSCLCFVIKKSNFDLL